MLIAILYINVPLHYTYETRIIIVYTVFAVCFSCYYHSGFERHVYATYGFERFMEEI